MKHIDPKSWLVCGGRPEQAGDPLNTPMVPASNFLLGGDRIYTRDTGAPGDRVRRIRLIEIAPGEQLEGRHGLAP